MLALIHRVLILGIELLLCEIKISDGFLLEIELILPRQWVDRYKIVGLAVPGAPCLASQYAYVLNQVPIDFVLVGILIRPLQVRAQVFYQANFIVAQDVGV